MNSTLDDESQSDVTMVLGNTGNAALWLGSVTHYYEEKTCR